MIKGIRDSTKIDYSPDGSSNKSNSKTTYHKTSKFNGDEDIKSLLIYQVKRAITKLYKSHLTQLEDLQQEHLASLHKAEDLVSEDFIQMMNFFDTKKHGYYRKKTLDAGNETARELENLLDNFEIRLKR